MSFSKKTIRDIDIDGKRVLMSVDFNVPVDDQGFVVNDYRIRQTLPTLQYLIERKCKIVLIGHLGRPEGKDDPKTSFRHVAEKLSDLIDQEVVFVDDCIGAKAKKASDSLDPGRIALLENLRYYEGEEANDIDFARQIVEASGAEVFVQDGFGTAHRKYASYDAVTKCGLQSVAGLLLEKEVSVILDVLESPDRPLMVIIGGAKISDKIELLERFIEIADCVVVVGVMANTFLMATDHKIGDSLAEPDKLEQARDILSKAHQKANKQRFNFFIPRDVVVAKNADNTSPTRIVDLSHNTWADIVSYPRKPSAELFEVATDEKILDIGPFSASHVAGLIKSSQTLIWNGTAGVTEIKGLSGAADPFSHGTKILVEAMIGEADERAKPYVIVGGGDTVGYVESVHGLQEQLGHVSTGGGAALELMSGKVLPGLVALEDK